jgi:hypothetical protein
MFTNTVTSYDEFDTYVDTIPWDYDYGTCDCCGETTYEFERNFGACLSDVLVLCSLCNGRRCHLG